ncbi:MAG: hypothetical protein AAGF67_14060, partial [Verrucomicrobiota bacterium]
MKHVFLAVVFLGVVSSGSAALPPLSPEELDEYAELVLTGEVLVSRVMIHRKPSASIYLVRLGVQIDSVEKGEDLLENPNTLEIRCWAMRKTKMVGPSGHLSIPAEGSKFRTWLRKNTEGQWEPLEPNGFELLEGSAPLTFAAAERRERGKGLLI